MLLLNLANIVIKTNLTTRHTCNDDLLLDIIQTIFYLYSSPDIQQASLLDVLFFLDMQQASVFNVLFSRHTTSYLPSLLSRSLVACWLRLSWPTIRSYRPSTCSTTECLFNTTPRPQSRSVLPCNQKEIVIIEKDFEFDHLDFKVFIQICMQWLSSDLSLQYNFVVSCILIVP